MKDAGARAKDSLDATKEKFKENLAECVGSLSLSISVYWSLCICPYLVCALCASSAASRRSRQTQRRRQHRAQQGVH